MHPDTPGKINEPIAAQLAVRTGDEEAIGLGQLFMQSFG
jgi:hypothetical protein